MVEKLVEKAKNGDSEAFNKLILNIQKELLIHLNLFKAIKKRCSIIK